MKIWTLVCVPIPLDIASISICDSTALYTDICMGVLLSLVHKNTWVVGATGSPAFVVDPAAY